MLTDTIIAILQLLAFISPFLIGRSLNNDFKEKYGVEAIRWDIFVWQCIFLALTAFTMFDSKISGWQILWIICTIASYGYALDEIRKHALKIGASSSDVTKAMISQAIYPLGATIIILTFLTMLLGRKKKKHYRHH